MTNDNFSIIINNLNRTYDNSSKRLMYQICHHSCKLDMRAVDSKCALLKASFMYFYMTDYNNLLNVSVVN